MHIMWDYILVTAIVIWPLIQPRTCERGSSIFVAMSGLKFASTTNAYFLRIPPTERKNGDFLMLFVTVITMVIYISLPPTIQEILHWLLPVGVHV